MSRTGFTATISRSSVLCFKVMTTLHDINKKARTALVEALGPVDYARYQQQFSTGSGDYTDERRLAANSDTPTISSEIAEMKAKGLLIPPSEARILEVESE